MSISAPSSLNRDPAGDRAASDLDAPYPLSTEQIRFFREQGYVKLKDVLPPALLARYGKEITAKVIELNTMDLPMEQRTTYQKAFLQVMNLWTRSEIVKEFVFSKRLARLATELMGCRGVRLYHDQALYKEPGGGVTPWHADQYYWPLGTDNTITAWVPLQSTPMELGPLAFSAKSHRFEFGRELEISDDSEQTLAQALKDKTQLVEEPFDLGEVSFHYGWTFHRAAANRSDRPREVMTVIYFDADARVIEPKNKHQKNDLQTWLPGAKIGEVAQTPLNPVLYASGD